jgi:hypothetical protein
MKQKDLSKAVQAVHQRAKQETQDAKEDVSAIPEHLLLYAGDAAGRTSFFEHTELVQNPNSKTHVWLMPKVTLPDYRRKNGKRTNRTMVTIPPGVKANIRACFGADTDEDFPMCTALIALADYAAMSLKRDGKTLVVDVPKDPLARERKAARMKIRRRARSALG